MTHIFDPFLFPFVIVFGNIIRRQLNTWTEIQPVTERLSLAQMIAVGKTNEGAK